MFSAGKGYYLGNCLYRIDFTADAFDGAVGSEVVLIVVCEGYDTLYQRILIAPTVNTAYISGSAPAIPSAASIADAVWDEDISDHDDEGSTGEALAAASTGGDPWATELPGSYGDGTAGKIIGGNLNEIGRASCRERV